MELKHTGLLSAHERLGHGMDTTWPNGMTRAVLGLPFPLPPIRLDHVFTTPNIVPLSIREGRGIGSDHKPVITRLAIVPPSTPIP
jgi:endonuclease/exonuclease/phosphatase (EEP) superfamily protein YafD